MSARRDSWTKNYEEVDFEVALERDRMLPSPTPTSSASMPVMSQSGATQAATFLSQSVSQPTVASSSSSSGHGHQHQRMPPPTQQDQHDPSGNSFSRSPRSSSFKAFPSSPLNPASPFSTPLPPSIPRSASTNAVATLAAGPNTSPPQAQLASPFGRPGSRQSINFSRMPSDMFNGSPYPGMPSAGSRGSMILYRRAEPGLSGTATPPLQTNHTGATDDSLLPPPPLSAFAINRASTYSTSGDSIISMGSDSKYPASVLGVTFGHGGGYGTERGLVAYAYDPEEDEESDDGEDDWLHDPEVEYPGSGKSSTSGSASSNSHGHPVKAAAAAGRTPPKQYASPLIPWRGIVNISTLALMVAALLCLFAVYPMYLHYKDQPVNARITGNARINSTGQAVEDDFDTVTGGGGPAPTDPGRTRVTQTSINDSGFNPTRRSLWPWKRNNEEWVAALPSTSYKLPYSIPPVQVPPPSERAILSDWKELIDDRTFEIDWHKAIPVSWSTETSPEYIPSIIPPPAEDYSVWDLAYSFIAPWSGALGLNLSLTLTEFPLATTEEWGMWQPSRSDAALDGSSAVSLYSSKRICVPAVNGENDVLVEVGLLVLDYRSRESQEFAARAIKATVSSRSFSFIYIRLGSFFGCPSRSMVRRSNQFRDVLVWRLDFIFFFLFGASYGCLVDCVVGAVRFTCGWVGSFASFFGLAYRAGC
ncbi:hypothetical protein FA15DRAFT_442463 [Coprinopsis marcescibilis]|uniref:Uncharacterized protein n=1 Tax=Coprinopsis marcescibilis TaxID=230819 RepID=A0A5C3KUA1_COPMA|nr:hypothetical protein FA15DRAFT_442463 [Coprinopsis marcescibilis]